MWFYNLFGFIEENPTHVRENIEWEDAFIISKANGQRFQCGRLEIPSLRELKEQAPSPSSYHDALNLIELVGNVEHIHIDPGNAQAVIQAASQFNLLEMVDPGVTPEEGIDIYEEDRTQGPVCAIACGAGTLFRNYLVPLNGQQGQSANNQVNCLADLAEALAPQIQQGLDMRNGYAFLEEEDLIRIGNHINNCSPEEYQLLKDRLRIGVQWDTEVTISPNKHLVTQAYCSALPIGYSHIHQQQWEPFARLVLEATYEATFYTALINYEKTGNKQLFLTLVGGGVFGNPLSWILEAIKKSVHTFRQTPLDVKIVSYRRSNPEVVEMLDAL